MAPTSPAVISISAYNSLPFTLRVIGTRPLALVLALSAAAFATAICLSVSALVYAPTFAAPRLISDVRASPFTLREAGTRPLALALALSAAFLATATCVSVSALVYAPTFAAPRLISDVRASPLTLREAGTRPLALSLAAFTAFGVAARVSSSLIVLLRMAKPLSLSVASG